MLYSQAAHADERAEVARQKAAEANERAANAEKAAEQEKLASTTLSEPVNLR
jgi:uncharacterized protein DUF3359